MKWPAKLQSLRTQLILVFMLISLIVLSAASYYMYSIMQNMIKDQNQRSLYQQFQQLDHNIRALFADIDRLSKLFLQDEQMQQLLLHLSDKSELEFLNYKNMLHARINTFIGNYGFVHSVYLTSESQGAIGGTADTTLVHPKEDWGNSFFGSAFYRRTLESFPEPIIVGGLKKSFYNPYMTEANDGTLVSLMRGVRAIYDPKTSATLIFNVDERYLASIYAVELDAEGGDMYMTDSDGVIISSSRPERIGTRSPFRPPQGESGEEEIFGSRDTVVGGTEVQVVYYKLQDAGWYIMKEIPLNLYSAQIFQAQRTMVAVFLLSMLAMFLVSYFWLRKIFRPLHKLSAKMKDMSRGELGVTFEEVPNNELGTVVRRFNEMSLSIVDLIDKNNRMQEAKRELEIEALQYQINPHFLYNTLNMIRWMASMIKADNIVGSVVALGNILRPAFASKEAMCTLRDELNYLENYIKIINWRFNNGVEFELSVAERDLEYKVPRFILQPLVENAIASGRQAEDFSIHIGIFAACEDGELRIAVSDSGEGIAPELLEALNRMLASGERSEDAVGGGGGGNGIGLYNVNKRIRLYFGPEYGLRFVPRTIGAEVVVRLPAIR